MKSNLNLLVVENSEEIIYDIHSSKFNNLFVKYMYENSSQENNIWNNMFYCSLNVFQEKNNMMHHPESTHLYDYAIQKLVEADNLMWLHNNNFLMNASDEIINAYCEIWRIIN